MPLALPAVARVGQGHTTNSLHPIDNALSMGQQGRNHRGRRLQALGTGRSIHLQRHSTIYLRWHGRCT